MMNSKVSKLNGHVLSIQSHVVHGHVGNRAAVFPLQIHDYEVDVINSVQFSNHTQYPHVKGQKLNDQNLLDLFEGLKLNHLTQYYTHLLTGYIGDITFMKGIAHIVDEIRKLNPNLIYLCDPVLGDVVSAGTGSETGSEVRLYVPQELIEQYKTILLPKADIITPNHYEAAILTNTPLEEIQKVNVVELLDKLHSLGPKTVILTSIPSLDNQQLTLYASKYTQENQRKVFRINFPKIHSHFTGTGDLVASLVLANMRSDVSLETSLEKAVAAVQFVLQETARQGGGELRLIECWRGIVDPQVEHFAESVPLP
jgi:pyridoxine kinase